MRFLKTYNVDDLVGFGKYHNKTWQEVKDIEPGYLIWMKGVSLDAPGREEFIDNMFTVEISLAEDQQIASDMVLTELYKNGHRVFRLEGGAGYGKSYAVMDIAQRVKKLGHSISAMATSYVASQVLSESLSPIGIEGRTIASALCLSPDKNKINESYVPGAETQDALDRILDNGCLLCIDEYSMCDDMVVNLIYDKMMQPGNTSKLLVIGDNKQLPSPAQQHMCMFDEITPSFALTIPKRYKPGSPLHTLEQSVRLDPFDVINTIVDSSIQGSEIVRHADFNAISKKLISDMVNYPDETMLMLFFKRSDVSEANNLIRSSVYGKNCEQLVDCERLRVMRTTFLPQNQQGTSLKFYSGTFIKAKNPIIKTVYVDFQDPNLPTNILPLIAVQCYVVDRAINDPDLGVIETQYPLLFSKNEHKADASMVGGKDFNEGLETVKQYCLENGGWPLYHHYRSHFVMAAYAYATTVHRTQGASVDRIYINPNDTLKAGSMSAALTYVAMTRAKKQLNYYIV